MKHGAKRIIVRKFTGIKTIGVTKMPGNFFEISFEGKFLQKALISLEFRQNLFALLLHNTVGARFSNSIPKKGRDPSHLISMVNLREGWVELRVSRKWPAVILSGITVRVSSMYLS